VQKDGYFFFVCFRFTHWVNVVKEVGMAYGVRLHVWGGYAFFINPESEGERASYHVMTPSAARGILESIHWKPPIRWVIDRLHVLKPIQFELVVLQDRAMNTIPVKRVGRSVKPRSDDKMLAAAGSSSQPSAGSQILCDVGYVIDAHVELTSKAGEGESIGKHLDMFKRRARKGGFFRQPVLGNKRFPARFKLIESDDDMPVSEMSAENRDFGLMLLDVDFTDNAIPRFYKAEMKKGVIDVPPL